jgi:translation elongation factor EF-1alpha
MAEILIGEVIDYFAKVGVVALRLTGSLKVGDRIKIKGGEHEFEQEVESIQIDRNPVESADDGDEAGIKVSERAHKGNKVYLVN